MKNLALALIKIYQQHVSPHKGFCCAYREHTDRPSCSMLGLRAIRRYGVWFGLPILRKRMYLCGVAHRRFSAPQRRQPITQRGDCDIGGCDAVPDFDLPSFKRCDFTSCYDAINCDWPRRDTPRRQRREAEVHLPPKHRS